MLVCLCRFKKYIEDEYTTHQSTNITLRYQTTLACPRIAWAKDLTYLHGIDCKASLLKVYLCFEVFPRG